MTTTSPELTVKLTLENIGVVLSLKEPTLQICSRDSDIAIQSCMAQRVAIASTQIRVATQWDDEGLRPTPKAGGMI